MDVETLKATELIWDTSIYPRQDVNENHVGVLADALKSGNVLPPIVVDKGSLRIVDGLHRWRASRKVYGDACELTCELHEYANDAELFLDAVQRNTAHGQGLTSFEKTKCIVGLEERGVTRDRIQEVLRITSDTYERLSYKTAYREVGGTKERIPLKSSMRALAGQVLNEKQVATNRYVGGMRVLYYVNSVSAMLESGICDEPSPELFAGLQRLQKALNQKLKNKKAN